MLTVHKYTLSVTRPVFRLPAGSEILSFGAQGDDIVMWVKLDDEAPLTEQYMFEVIGTGWEMSDKNYKFRQTVQTPAGLVFHVFEVSHVHS